MDLKKAIGILREYYKLHYDYPDEKSTKDFQNIKYAMQTILSFCETALKLQESGMPKKKERLKEVLADIEHQRWASWHKYCRLMWTPEMVERWDKQAETPYIALSEKEKESDREQVNRYWYLIEQFIDEMTAWIVSRVNVERMLKILSEELNKGLFVEESTEQILRWQAEAIVKDILGGKEGG